MTLPAAGADAQAPPTTVAFADAYRGFNAWDGWRGAGAARCNVAMPLQGSEPAAPGRYPVLVYLHGTLADWGGNVEGRLIADAAAEAGFVAIAASYDSVTVTGPAEVEANARCVFGGGAQSAVSRACAQAKADCARGVVVVGFSAGGAIAGRAANVSARVRAAWLLGVDGPAAPRALARPAGTRALPDRRLRIAVGRLDLAAGDAAALNRITGQACRSPTCLRADGSGYVVVQDFEVVDGVADHCFWMSVNPVVPSNSCTWTPELDPGFRDPSRLWSLPAGLAWLRTATR